MRGDTRLDRHQHELPVLARVQHATEIRIFLGQLFDVDHEDLYGLRFRFSGRYDLPLDFAHDLLHYQELFKDQPRIASGRRYLSRSLRKIRCKRTTNSSGAYSRRFAGSNAQDRVQRAPANKSGSERDEPDPTPHRLIGRPEEADSSGDKCKSDDDSQDPIDSSDICSHDISLPLE